MEFTSYEGLNGYDLYNSRRTAGGLVENDETTRYFMRSLYQRVYAGFNPLNCPPLWDINYFKNVVLSEGYIAIIDDPKYGIIPQICAPTGERGIFLQPTKILVSQPLVQFNGTLGEDCELIRLTPDWLGIWDIIEHYAVRMAITVTSLDVSLFNSRASFIAAGKNKSATVTIKSLFEDMMKGKPLLVYDKEMKGEGLDDSDPIWTYNADIKNNFIADKLIDALHSIREDFDQEIGIAAIGQKKERMITDEVSQLTADATARAETWYDMLSMTYDKVNALFSELNLSFSLKYGGEVHNYGED